MTGPGTTRLPETSGSCEGCAAAVHAIARAPRDEAPMVAPWKPLAEHPHLRPLPPVYPRQGTAFCQRCSGLWLITWDQYTPMWLCTAIDAYAAVFEPEASLAALPSVLKGDGLGRGLVRGFLQLPRIDPHAAVRTIVESLGARGLDDSEVRELLADLRATFDHPSLSGGPRPAIRLDDAGPLVALLDRVYPGDGAANIELRNDVADLVRAMFRSAFDPHASDFVGMPGEARETLLRRTDPERRWERAQAAMRQRGGDELGRLNEAVKELHTLVFTAGRRPTADDVRLLLDTYARVRDVTAADDGTGQRIARLADDCHTLLSALFQSRLVPDAVRREVRALVAPETGAPAHPPAAPASTALVRIAELGPPSTAPATPAVPRVSPAAAVPAKPPPRPWRPAETLALAVIPLVSVALVVVAGIGLGESLIPWGHVASTMLLAGAIAAVLGVALHVCPLRRPELAVAVAALVALGVLGWGHWVAYDWEAPAWAASYYAARGVDVGGAAHADLRDRFIREKLAWRTGLGPLDMLRVRAAVGVEVRPRRRRTWNLERHGPELWVRWAAQALLVTAGAGLGGIIGAARAISTKEQA